MGLLRQSAGFFVERSSLLRHHKPTEIIPILPLPSPEVPFLPTAIFDSLASHNSTVYAHNGETLAFFSQVSPIGWPRPQPAQAMAAPEPGFTCGPLRALPEARHGRIAARHPSRCLVQDLRRVCEEAAEHDLSPLTKALGTFRAGLRIEPMGERWEGHTGKRNTVQRTETQTISLRNWHFSSRTLWRNCRHAKIPSWLITKCAIVIDGSEPHRYSSRPNPIFLVFSWYTCMEHVRVLSLV